MATLPAEMLCLIIEQTNDRITLQRLIEATQGNAVLQEACLKAQDAMETVTIHQDDLLAGPRTSPWDPDKGSGLIKRLITPFTNPQDPEYPTPASNIKHLKLNFHFRFAETSDGLEDYADVKFTLETLFEYLKNVDVVEVDGLFYEETLKQIVRLLKGSVTVLKLGKSVPRVKCVWACKRDDEKYREDYEDDENSDEGEDVVLEPRPLIDEYFDWTALNPFKRRLQVLEIHQLQPGDGDSLAAAVERLRVLERLVVCATNVPECKGDNYGSSAMGIFLFHIFHWDDRYHGCRLPKTLKSLALVDIHSMETGIEAAPRGWEKPACPALADAYIDIIDRKATKRIMDWLQVRKLRRFALPGPTALRLLYRQRDPTPGDPMSMLRLFPQTLGDWFQLQLVGLVKANKHRIEELTMTDIWNSQKLLKPKHPVIDWWNFLPVLELVLGTERADENKDGLGFSLGQFYSGSDGEEDIDSEDEFGWDDESESEDEDDEDDEGDQEDVKDDKETKSNFKGGEAANKKFQLQRTLDALFTDIYGFKPTLTIMTGWGFRLERLKIEPIDFAVMLSANTVLDPSLKPVRILVLQPRSKHEAHLPPLETLLSVKPVELAQHIAAQDGLPNLKVIVIRERQFWIERGYGSSDASASIKVGDLSDALADPRQKAEINKCLSPRDWAFIEETLDTPSSVPNSQTIRHRNYMVMHKDDSSGRGVSLPRFERFEKEPTSLNYEYAGYIAKDFHAFP